MQFWPYISVKLFQIWISGFGGVLFKDFSISCSSGHFVWRSNFGRGHYGDHSFSKLSDNVILFSYFYVTSAYLMLVQ